ARSAAQQCASTQIAGSMIHWYDTRLVTFYPGHNGDDCDEITVASISVADDRCTLIKRHEIYGMAQVLDTSAQRTTAAFAPWRNKCGSGYELRPWNVFTVDTQTGAKTPAPGRDAEARRRWKAIEEVQT